MAWPTGGPKTWGSELDTSADRNSYIRDTTREIWRLINKTTFNSDIVTTTATEASPLDVVSSGALTYTAEEIRVDFYSPKIVIPTSGGLSVWDASTDLGRMIYDIGGATSGVHSYFTTPSAASHTYKIRIWTAGGATASAAAGAGGVGVKTLGWIAVWQRGV